MSEISRVEKNEHSNVETELGNGVVMIDQTANTGVDDDVNKENYIPLMQESSIQNTDNTNSAELANTTTESTFGEIKEPQKEEQDEEEEEDEEEGVDDEDDEDDEDEGDEGDDSIEEVIVKDEEDVFKNVAQGLEGKYRELLIDFWQDLINKIESLNENTDDLLEKQPQSPQNKRSVPNEIVEIQDSFKNHNLPLARIKKVMKIDENVKMISAETPILFAQACEIFITELTLRAWSIADDNKRRTLQKQDVADALQKSDMYDFLIDIVPRQISK